MPLFVYQGILALSNVVLTCSTSPCAPVMTTSNGESVTTTMTTTAQPTTTTKSTTTTTTTTAQPTTTTESTTTTTTTTTTTGHPKTTTESTKTTATGQPKTTTESTTAPPTTTTESATTTAQPTTTTEATTTTTAQPTTPTESTTTTTTTTAWARVSGKKPKYNGIKVAKRIELQACDSEINNECKKRMASDQTYGVFTLAKYVYQDLLTLSDVSITCSTSKCPVTTEPMTTTPDPATTASTLFSTTNSIEFTSSDKEPTSPSPIAIKDVDLDSRPKMNCKVSCVLINQETERERQCPARVQETWNFCRSANDKYWALVTGERYYYMGVKVGTGFQMEVCDTAINYECNHRMAPGETYGVFKDNSYTITNQISIRIENATLTCMRASECPTEKLCKIACRSNVEENCPSNFTGTYCINLNNWCAKRWSTECESKKTATISNRGTTVIYSTTETNRTCQNCTNQTPHNHSFGFVGDHNHCQNPDGNGSPWCFTMYPNVRWEFCFKNCNPACIDSTKQYAMNKLNLCRSTIMGPCDDRGQITSKTMSPTQLDHTTANKP